MRKLILLAAVVALLPSLLWAQTIEEKDTVKIREFSDLTNLGTIGTGDTSLQVAAYDPVTDSINERTSFNAILRGVQYVLSAGYGIDFTNLTFSVDTTNEIASKEYVDNLIDDVGGGSGTESIFKIENSSTNATAGSTNNYHTGEIGIGDFSSNLIAAPIHVYATDARIRLSDSTSTDTTAMMYVEMYRGYNANLLGRVGYLSNSNTYFSIENTLTGGGIDFETEGTAKLRILPDGQLQLYEYGDTLHTGTAVKYLAVTNEGLVIEVDGGAGGGSWTTAADSVYLTGKNVGIGTTGPFDPLTISGATNVDFTLNNSNQTYYHTLSATTTGKLNIISNWDGSAQSNAAKSTLRFSNDTEASQFNFEHISAGGSTFSRLATIDKDTASFHVPIWATDTTHFANDIYVRSAAPSIHFHKTGSTFGGRINQTSGGDIQWAVNLFGGQQDATLPSYRVTLDPVNDFVRYQRQPAGGSLANLMVLYPDSLVYSGDIKTSGGAFIDDGTTLDAPDYVFEDSYNFLPIHEYINTVKGQKHLIGARSADELKKEVPITEEMYANREAIENNVLYIEVLLNKIEALEKRILELEKAKE